MTIPNALSGPQAISRREVLHQFASEEALDVNGARVAVLGSGSVGGLASDLAVTRQRVLGSACRARRRFFCAFLDK